MMATVSTRLPLRGQLTLDHISHFVPHLEPASAALQRLGFTLTPYSEQMHRLEPGGPLVSAGTANRCVMLRQGYLECLTPTGDTPHAAQLRAAIKRHVGVHAVVFGTADAAADHARLATAGFAPLSPVALQREIGTLDGHATARFTVVRVAPGTMAEGRIQFCQHHTPHLLWQERWTEHANRAAGLAGVVLCVDDPQEAAQRHARFTGLLAQVIGNTWRIDTAQGWLLFARRESLERAFGWPLPPAPSIAGYALVSDNAAFTRNYLAKAGFTSQPVDAERFCVALPPALGGIMMFEPQNHPAPMLALGGL